MTMNRDGNRRRPDGGRFVGPSPDAGRSGNRITTTATARDGRTGRFTIGARGMEKLNAIEGISLSRVSRAMFSDFDSRDLSPEERREAIIARHAGKR